MRGSKQDIPTTFSTPAGVVRHLEWGGINVETGEFWNALDLGPLYQGLPNDRCPVRHWGYVVRGELRFVFADHDERFQAGDIYFVRPGHTLEIAAGTEYVEWSAADQVRETIEVVGQRLNEVPSTEL